MRKFRRLVVLIALILVFVLSVLLSFVYTPLRIRYVISRIESAMTPAEERLAFRLARRYQPFYRLYGPTNAYGTVVPEGGGLVIVFRQISPLTHQHYAARRTLLAETNLVYLESNVLRPVKF